MYKTEALKKDIDIFLGENNVDGIIKDVTEQWNKGNTNPCLTIRYGKNRLAIKHFEKKNYV